MSYTVAVVVFLCIFYLTNECWSVEGFSYFFYITKCVQCDRCIMHRALDVERKREESLFRKWAGLIPEVSIYGFVENKSFYTYDCVTSVFKCIIDYKNTISKYCTKQCPRSTENLYESKKSRISCRCIQLNFHGISVVFNWKYETKREVSWFCTKLQS